MTPLLQRSLFGQIAIVMTLALVVASVVNVAFVFGERARATLLETSGPAIGRFVDALSIASEDPGRFERLRNGGPARVFRGGRFGLTDESLVDRRGLRRLSAVELQLERAIEQEGLEVQAVRAALDRSQRAPPMLPRAIEWENRPDGPRRRVVVVVLSAQTPGGQWVNAQFPAPAPPQTGEYGRVLVSTLVLFGFVLAGALWVADRIARPLKSLADAAGRVGAGGEPPRLALEGPRDVRQTLEAFNRMSERVEQLLKEKDVMLGALGHDLRTPLASLRIRIEQIEPESERMKAARTIEETTLLLDDILALARRGRSSEPAQPVDAARLVAEIVEDYRETGAPVEAGEMIRSPVQCQPVLLRRALRNLIDNAVVHGAGATVSVHPQGEAVEIRIEDEGPGVAPGEIEALFQPFVRGEASRSRSKGGAGLGLDLAQAIVRAQAGELSLAPREPKGLAAVIRLPLFSPTPRVD